MNLFTVQLIAIVSKPFWSNAGSGNVAGTCTIMKNAFVKPGMSIITQIVFPAIASHSVTVSSVALIVIASESVTVERPATNLDSKSSNAEASIVSGVIVTSPIELILVSCEYSSATVTFARQRALCK